METITMKQLTREDQGQKYPPKLSFAWIGLTCFDERGAYIG